MKILVINGPNLNILGKRDKNHYGDLSLDKIETLLKDEFKEITFEFYQSNIEGEIITKVQDAENNYNGIIINPGGYAHTSVAIRDALADCKIPKVEVHLSHLASREEFRQNLVTATACDGYISGFKENSYLAGAYLMMKLLK
ncbi:MAG TPA: type II 3-dehydroquinate dehydratase [Ignavibacteriaceae bacterium]|nr:type II 3-dehydroquinate dehydratase [Ignavibacteriaceae bacterium]